MGAGLSAAGSIFGGISASNAMRGVKRSLQRQARENDNWYNRRYNEDVTQRADAQRILTRTQEMLRDRNRAAAGTRAVMGGTEESVAATKAANAQAMAEAASQIAVAGERRKDEVEQVYRQRDAQIEEALNNLKSNKAQAIASAVQGVVQAGAGIAGAF